jgi:hypothetical protein
MPMVQGRCSTALIGQKHQVHGVKSKVRDAQAMCCWRQQDCAQQSTSQPGAANAQTRMNAQTHMHTT